MKTVTGSYKLQNEDNFCKKVILKSFFAKVFSEAS